MTAHHSWRARVDKALGPPAPFFKMLIGWAGALVSTYVLVLPPVGHGWVDILGQSVTLGILGAGLISCVLLLTWAGLDYIRHHGALDPRESFKGVVVMCLGFLVFQAL